MTHIVAIINLKGGVGKTTTTAALAEILSAEFAKRVLLIDLDPQTNLTTMMIGERRWRELNDQGLTLATLFRDSLTGDPSQKSFDLENTLQRSVSPMKKVTSVDLLPSSLDLIDIQESLASTQTGPFHANDRTDVLLQALKPIQDDYDYVLIDCPPNLGIITLNGLRVADGYIIPTIPDLMSTNGIPQVQKRVREFGASRGKRIVELGIVITKYRQSSTVHRNTVEDLIRRKDLPMLFPSKIPEANQMAAAAEFTDFGTLRQKYGTQGQFAALYELAQDFIAIIRIRLP